MVPAAILVPLLALAPAGCLHVHGLPNHDLSQDLAKLSGTSPSAREPVQASALPWLLSGLPALGLGAFRLRRAWRAVASRRPLQAVDREDLALLRTAVDALRFLLRKQMERWRVANFRRAPPGRVPPARHSGSGPGAPGGA